MADWSVAIAQPNSQPLALLNLEAQGFNCYFPKFLETTVVRGRVNVRRVFLFGTYFFFELTDRWRSVSGTRGVFSLMMWSEGPSRVPEYEIDSIRQREDRDGYVTVDGRISSPSSFRKGEHVQVAYGSMFGEHGIVAGMRGGDRVRVLFNMLGRRTPVTMRTSELIRA